MTQNMAEACPAPTHLDIPIDVLLDGVKRHAEFICAPNTGLWGKEGEERHDKTRGTDATTSYIGTITRHKRG